MNDEIKPKIYVPMWLAVPRTIREKIAEIFNISKSEGVIVDGDRVASDGRTNEDLEVLDNKKIATYLNLDAEAAEKMDLFQLFSLLVKKIDEKITNGEEALQSFADVLEANKTAKAEEGSDKPETTTAPEQPVSTATTNQPEATKSGDVEPETQEGFQDDSENMEE